MITTMINVRTRKFSKEQSAFLTVRTTQLKATLASGLDTCGRTSYNLATEPRRDLVSSDHNLKLFSDLHEGLAHHHQYKSEIVFI